MTILHVCLAITKLIPYELNSMENVCNIFAYASYFSLIACFSWLFVMCHDVSRSLGKQRRRQTLSDDVPVNSLNSEQGKDKNSLHRFCFYFLCAFGFPMLVTAVIFFTDHHFESHEFHRCTRLRSEILDTKFDYVFLPVLVVATYGIVLFAQTKTRLQKVLKETKNQTESLEKDKKRFEGWSN